MREASGARPRRARRPTTRIASRDVFTRSSRTLGTTPDRPLAPEKKRERKTKTQPLHTLKNFAQDGRRLPLNPAVWYRGWTAGVLMCVPMTVVQFGTARRLERLFEKRERGPEGSAADADAEAISVKHTTLPPAARFAAAWLAGAASGACIQPLDVMMTQQQKFGGSLIETARRIANTEIKNRGGSIGARTRGFALFARGAWLTVAREAFYSCGYLASVPSLREARPDLPLAACAVASGLGAAVLTQPLDTVKTVMQSNLVQPRDDAAVSDVRRAAPAGGRGAERLGGLGYGATAAALVNEGGVLSLWRGLVPRGARIVGATFILSLVNERAGEAIVSWRGDER